MSSDDRNKYVIFKVTEVQARAIRNLVHSQEWYDGFDASIAKSDILLYGTKIPVYHIYDMLELFHREVAKHFGLKK